MLQPGRSCAKAGKATGPGSRRPREYTLRSPPGLCGSKPYPSACTCQWRVGGRRHQCWPGGAVGRWDARQWRHCERVDCRPESPRRRHILSCARPRASRCGNGLDEAQSTWWPAAEQAWPGDSRCLPCAAWGRGCVGRRGAACCARHGGAGADRGRARASRVAQCSMAAGGGRTGGATGGGGRHGRTAPKRRHARLTPRRQRCQSLHGLRHIPVM